mmetsp:Transcript_11223/g.31054  ORF Transcript_11223/g.31054 Transcript_11223/m.31054 type:complete len:93 (-) Transcript_11223:662-940(-)
MDHLEPQIVGLERSLMVKVKTLDRLSKELTEAKNKQSDKSLASDKKTFLKVQIPKLEKEIKSTKKKVIDLLDAEELDPRGEYYVLGKKLTKK